MLNKKQLFFSHNWGEDIFKRDNHNRVKRIKNLLIKYYGWSIWFDEDDMSWNIDGSMYKGIIESELAVVFLTQKYINKIENNCLDPNNRDNCAKEWNLINVKKKRILPIVLEKNLLNISKWENTLVGMYLGTYMLLDVSKITTNNIKKINDFIIKNHNLIPNNNQNLASNNNQVLNLIPLLPNNSMHLLSDDSNLVLKLSKNDKNIIIDSNNFTSNRKKIEKLPSIN